MSRRKIIFSIIAVFMIFNLLGCEAFVRKFTRKPKGPQVQETPVLAPEEYKGPQISKEEQYRQFFVFWRSWQDELIQALLAVDRPNYKKQVDCVKEAIKNLVSMRVYLKPEKQKKLDGFVVKMNDLKGLIVDDLYGRNLNWNRLKAEKLRRDIIRDLSFPKIKPYIIS
jgi:hypothetical protein